MIAYPHYHPHAAARLAGVSYRTTAFETASPAKITLLLMEGALAAVEQAEAALRPSPSGAGDHRDDVEAAGGRHHPHHDTPPLPTFTSRRLETVHNRITKAQAIVRELEGSLDPGADGEFARQMRRLYPYLDEQLTEANRRKDPAPLALFAELLGPIRDAWAQAMAGMEERNTNACAHARAEAGLDADTVGAGRFAAVS